MEGFLLFARSGSAFDLKQCFRALAALKAAGAYNVSLICPESSNVTDGVINYLKAGNSLKANFDEIILIDDSYYLSGAKFTPELPLSALYDLSPYDTTIYIDSSLLINWRANFNYLFTTLSGQAVWSKHALLTDSPSPSTSGFTINGNITIANMEAATGYTFVNPIYDIEGKLIYFDKSPTAAAVFADAADCIQSLSNTSSANISNALSYSLSKNNITPGFPLLNALTNINEDVSEAQFYSDMYFVDALTNTANTALKDRINRRTAEKSGIRLPETLYR